MILPATPARVLALPLSLLIAVAACGGDDDAMTVDEYLAELVIAQCVNAVECEAAPDAETCAAANAIAGIDVATAILAVEEGRVEFDSGAASACLGEIRGGSCSFDGFYLGDSACDGVFAGTIEVGGACVHPLECVGDATCTPSDSACDPTAACCEGSCEGGSAAKGQGESCAAAGDACESDLYCLFTSDTAATCEEPIATAGTECFDLFACANPMYCDIFADVPTCVAPVAHGETCNPDLLLPCSDFRDYCDFETTTCTESVAVDAACGGANGALCVGYASCVDGTCVENPGEGEACVVDGQECLGQLECTGGSCEGPSDGEACPAAAARTLADVAPRRQPLDDARRAAVTALLERVPAPLRDGRRAGGRLGTIR